MRLVSKVKTHLQRKNEAHNQIHDVPIVCLDTFWTDEKCRRCLKWTQNKDKTSWLNAENASQCEASELSYFATVIFTLSFILGFLLRSLHFLILTKWNKKPVVCHITYFTLYRYMAGAFVATWPTGALTTRVRFPVYLIRYPV